MALTRKFLTALGIESDKIDEIIDAHTETVNGLKAERDEYKASAEKLPEIEKALKKANETIEAQGTDAYKEKYESIKTEYDEYKKAQSEKEVAQAKDTAYRAMLKEAGVSEKRIDSIMRVTDLSKIELEDGKVKDANTHTENIKKEWADFITSTESEGAGTQTPPPAGKDGESTPPAIPTIF